MQKFTGLGYMKIYLANCFGHDKLTWDERLAWADETLSSTEKINAALDEAEEPNLFLKTCNAIDDALAGIPTGFIMGLDATASGLQIMACLTGCHATARQVNLISTGKREDAYLNVAEDMGMPHITKAEVKYPVMTHYYNSTAKPKELLGDGSPELEQFYKSLAKLFKGAEEAKADMQACWRGDVEAHQWTLPDGHTAYVRVGDYEEKKIELNELKTSKGNNATFTYRAKTFKPSQYGISLPANIIHSIDGWLVRELRRRCKADGFDMIAVHDQFFCSPNHMQKLREHYLAIMIDIAESDMLGDILGQILGYEIDYHKQSNNLAEAMRSAEYAIC